MSGVPAAEGELVVRVTDAAGQGSERAFQLSSKRACWLAYLSADEAGTSLHLADVFAQVDVTLLPEGAPPASVLDFAFSPAGDRIAFRLQDAQRTDLYLYQLPEQVPEPPSTAALPVAFECPAGGAGTCSVRDYAWSADSRHLAVVLDAGSEARAYVSGLNVQTPSPAWPVIEAASWNDSETLPLVDVSQLAWVGSSWVAWIGSNPEAPELSTLYTAELTAQGNALVGALGTDYESGAAPHLRAVRTGVLLSYAPPGEVLRDVCFSQRGVPTGTVSDVKECYEGWPSPSGELVGSVSGEARLQLYELGSTSISAESAADACTEILTWSPRVAGRERILCSYGPYARRRLRVFDYFADQRLLSPPADIDVPFTVGNERSRRVLSEPGDWLALAAETGAVSLIDLGQFEPRLEGLTPRLAAPGELSFAPGRSTLVLLDPSGLTEQPLPPGRPGAKWFPASEGAPIGAPCQAAFWEAPDHWCGATQISDHLAYSEDSEAALFEGPTGTLTLADAASNPQAPAVALTTTLPACGAACKARFAFRPQP